MEVVFHHDEFSPPFLVGWLYKKSFGVVEFFVGIFSGWKKLRTPWNQTKFAPEKMDAKKTKIRCLSLADFVSLGFGLRKPRKIVGLEGHDPSFTSWWFQRFFMFNPTWGDDPIWLIFSRWVETTNEFKSGPLFKRDIHSFSRVPHLWMVLTPV